MINEDDLLEYMNSFICDIGQWNAFIEFLKSKGYKEEELKDL